MEKLLEKYENDFLDANNDQLQDYLQNELITKFLIMCTQSKINEDKFIKEFESFSFCLRNKMFKMTKSIETTYEQSSRTITPHQRKTLEIPAIIESEIINKALLKGFPLIKKELKEYLESMGKNFDDFDDIREIGFVFVLLIIARANLAHKFAN